MRTKNLAIIALGAATLSLSSCGGSSSQQAKEGELTGEVSLSGAFALYPLAVVWVEEFQKLHPNVRVDISAGGAGKGMTDALAGVVDFGMVSREIYPAEKEKGAVGFAVAKDAVVPTINANNPVIDQLLKKGLTTEGAKKIWITGEAKTWGDILGNGDQTPLHAYTRSDACGAAETWAMWFGAKQEELGGTAVFGAPGGASGGQRDIYGSGMNNIGYAYDNDTHKLNDGLLILPLDSNNDGQITPDEDFYALKDSVTKAIAEDRYPSPPARDLYLVSKGVPKNAAVREFLRYVLTDGQVKNAPTGYIEISSEKIKNELELLDSEKAE